MTKLLNLKTLLLVAACLAAALCANGYDFYKDGFYYNIKDGNTVEVTFQNVDGTDTYTGVITIPEQVTYNGTTYLVNKIGYNAFSLSTLTEVIIPSNITYIGGNAFRLCYSLEKVTMTDSVTTIGYQAFSGCRKLREITLSDNLEDIPQGCFSWCDSLKAITLPHALKTIGSEAFKKTNNLKTITCMAWTNTTWENEDVFEADVKANATLMAPKTFYNWYKAIGPWNAFSNIKSLSYDVVKDGIYYVLNNMSTLDVTYKDNYYNTYSGIVSIPNSVSLPEGNIDVDGIGSCAFLNCRNLTNVSLNTNIKIIHDRAFMTCTSLDNISIPSSVETIEYYAFVNCTSLRSIILREGLKTIGSQAMAGIALTSIMLPASLESINGNSLSCNTSMKTIRINAANPFYTSKDGVLYTIDGKTLMTYPAGKNGDTYNVLDGTEVIANNAFDRARSLTNINLPNSLKEVQSCAFRECNALQVMEFPFGMTTLGSSAMDNCNTMSYVILPSSVTYIGSNAFYRCTSLNDIYIKATTPPYCDTYEWYDYDWDEDVIDYAFTAAQFRNAIVHVPEGTVSTYRNAETWKKFSNFSETWYEPEFILGDADGDGKVGIADVTVLIDYILGGGDIDTNAADMDMNGNIGISDVTALIDYILEGH